MLTKNYSKGSLIMSFDKLRTNGKVLIPFVVSREPVERSNHEWNQLVQKLPKIMLRLTLFILLFGMNISYADEPTVVVLHM